MKKFILVVLLVAFFGAAFYVYTLYTGKVKSLESVKAEETVSASQLIATFEQDSASANKKYLGKIIMVSGNLKSIEKDAGNLILGEPGAMSSVRCSLDSNFVKKIPSLNLNQPVIIKGACIGFNPDEFGLGSDVVLNRCVISE